MKSSFYHLLFAILACIAAITAYGFRYAQIADASSRATSLQNDIAAKTQAIQNASATRAALAKISDDERVMQDYFVSEEDVVAFIDDLEMRGRTLGAVVSVGAVSSDKKLSPPPLIISMEIQGTFDATMRTIGSIEYAPHDITVSALSLNKDETKDGWRASMTIHVGSNATTSPKKP